MNNYSKLKEVALKEGFVYKTCNPSILELLSKFQMNKIISAIRFGDYTDLSLKINKKMYVAEVTPMCDIMELDIVFMSKLDYETRYGKDK